MINSNLLLLSLNWLWTRDPTQPTKNKIISTQPSPTQPVSSGLIQPMDNSAWPCSHFQLYEPSRLASCSAAKYLSVFNDLLCCASAQWLRQISIGDIIIHQLDSLRWFSQRRSRTPHLFVLSTRGAMTPKVELGRDFCTVPPSFVILYLLVRKLSCWQTNTPINKQTNKQMSLKTSNVLRYTATLGINLILCQYNCSFFPKVALKPFAATSVTICRVKNRTAESSARHAKVNRWPNSQTSRDSCR